MYTELITAIKKKKELQGLDDAFVQKELNLYFKTSPKLATVNPKSAQFKKVIKEVRFTLRRVYGLFRDEKEKRNQLLEKFIKKPSQEAIHSLLKTHASTKERIESYPSLYTQLFKLNPKIILDIGCGINPLSSFFFPSKTMYYAYDLSYEEISLLNHFFKAVTFVKGRAAILDISNTRKVSKLPIADLAFLFKITDVLDRNKGHKNAETLIKAVPAKVIIVSFATKTMSGKRMRAPRRTWMEWLCNRLHYKFNILEFENEIFYCIQK